MLMDPNPQANTANYPIPEGKGGGRNTANPSPSTPQPTKLQSTSASTPLL